MNNAVVMWKELTSACNTESNTKMNNDLNNVSQNNYTYNFILSWNYNRNDAFRVFYQFFNSSLLFDHV